MKYNFPLLIRKDDIYVLRGNEITRSFVMDGRGCVSIFSSQYPLGQMAYEEIMGFVMKRKL